MNATSIINKSLNKNILPESKDQNVALIRSITMVFKVEHIFLKNSKVRLSCK